jgi:hypothetical protein
LLSNHDSLGELLESHWDLSRSPDKVIQLLWCRSL